MVFLPPRQQGFSTGPSGNRVWGAGGGSSGPSQSSTELNRLRNRTNGLDFQSQVSAAGVTGYQEPLPGIDLQWLWQTDSQAGFALTQNTRRGGLNMQRGNIESAISRQAESEGLASHSQDELILAFETDVQQTQQVRAWKMVSTIFQGRACTVTDSGSMSGPEIRLWYETSESDPTITSLLISSTLTGYGHVGGISTVRVGGVDYLLILTTARVIWINSSFAVAATTTGWPIRLDDGTTTTWNINQLVCQSPLPGNPLIVIVGYGVALVPSDAIGDTGSSVIAQLKIRRPVNSFYNFGFMSVAGRPSRLYFLEAVSPSEAYLASLDPYGFTYQSHTLSTTRIVGGVPLRARGKIAFTIGTDVILWDGREEQLGIFADTAPVDGYVLYCPFLWTDSGELYAKVDEYPEANPLHAYGPEYGQGRIRACDYKYDFQLGRWYQISEWEVYTSDGLINWNNNGAVQGADHPTAGFPGFTSAQFPNGGMFGPSTRNMHTLVAPPVDLVGSASLPSLPTTFAATWTRKFQEPSAVNPYSLRGGFKVYATYGRDRTPGLIFPGRSRYANKYIDEVYYGGVDSGGTGSSVTTRIGEYGHMDDVDSTTDRQLIEHTFEYGLTHDQRRYPFQSNKTALMVPQLEIQIDGGSDETLTPQALPITWIGHVDFFPVNRPESNLESGRSKA